MTDNIEKAWGKLISQTFRLINPIKRKIINTDCEVHLFIQKNAVDVLEKEGYSKQTSFFRAFEPYVNKGLVWADQDFKSYFHFYNPEDKRGMYGHSTNAMTLTNTYYENALYFINKGDYKNGMAYFGAACHIIQDLTIPQHAKRRLLDNHRQFEIYVKMNYKKIKRFKTREKPLIYKSVSEYVYNNAKSALYIDYMYRNIDDYKSKFYLVAFDALNISQRTTAGFMLMFYDDLKDLIKEKNS